MAALERHHGHLVLRRPGGRDGHTESFRTDMEAVIADAAMMGDYPSAANAARRARAALDAAATGPIVTPESLEAVPTDLDLGLSRMGRAPLDRNAVCPKCHGNYRINLIVCGDTVDAVLV